MKNKRHLNEIFSRVFGSNVGNPDRYNTTICGIGGDDDGDAGGGEDPKPQPFNKDQKTEISNIMHQGLSRAMPKALAKHLGSEEFNKAIATNIEGAMAGLTETLIEKFGASQTPTPDPKPGDSPAPPMSFKDSPEYQDMLKRDKAREDRVKKMEDDRKSEIETARRSEEKSALSTALLAAGVDPTRLRGALSVLISEDQVIQRDENGAMYYKANRGEFSEDFSIEDGVKDYLLGDEGKSLLPATGARGTGATGGTQEKTQRISQPAAKMSKKEAAEVIQTNFLAG